ncbi:MAG: DUF3685 domain-containing protein [Elainellaceae cyanobacterium]
MTTPPPIAPIRVAVIDDDAIFRMGICSWLRTQNIDVVAEGAALSAALLEPQGSLQPDVILYGFNRGAAAVRPAIRALEAMTSQPILVLGPVDTAVALRAQQAGAKGYWGKGRDPQTLLTAINRVAAGGEGWSVSYWQTTPVSADGGLNRWRHRLHASGLGQIEAAIADLDEQLAANLPSLDRAVAAGHRRELRAARGLVNWLLAPRLVESPAAVEQNQPAVEPVSSAASGPSAAIAASQQRTNRAIRRRSESAAPMRGGAIVPGGIQATLFEALDTKLQSPLRNQTHRPLELDILREEKRRELLYQVLQALETLLGELRQANVKPTQILEQRSRLLQDLWQDVITEFFGKYYVVSIEGVELEVVPLLLRETDRISRDLDTIAGVADLLAHVLFQDPLPVDSVPHTVGTAPAMARAEQLLDNLVVRIANAVVQPMLNQLGDIEVIKQAFYTRRLLSSRDIAQFRNDLSWHYRLTDYLYNPLDIFESQIRLFRLGPIGIEEQAVYTPRRTELEQLKGIRLGVTLLLELRDALAPRFRALVSWAGKLAVYILTEVLGRGIGLVGRGILRGIGSAWRDVRISRDSPKETVSDHRR